jgi:hypothetical protein
MTRSRAVPLLALLALMVSVTAAAQAKVTPRQAQDAIEKAGGKLETTSGNGVTHTTVTFPKMTDDDLKPLVPALQALPHLYALNLVSTDVTDKGVALLKPLARLEVLHLHETKVTDKCIPTLKAMQALQTVVLSKTGVTPAGIRALRQAKPLMTIID